MSRNPILLFPELDMEHIDRPMAIQQVSSRPSHSSEREERTDLLIVRSSWIFFCITAMPYCEPLHHSLWECPRSRGTRICSRRTRTHHRRSHSSLSGAPPRST